MVTKTIHTRNGYLIKYASLEFSYNLNIIRTIDAIPSILGKANSLDVT